MQDSLNDLLNSSYGFAVLPVFFVVMWCLSSFLGGLFTGWYALSKRFTRQSDPYGETKSAGPFFYTVYMRFWSHYSSAIRMVAAQDGLYLSVLFPLRIGHPPLSIPWKEIQFAITEGVWRRYVVLTLGNEEQIPMRIPERMARNLGILNRIPEASSLPAEPNFDNLSERFSDPSGRKPN